MRLTPFLIASSLSINATLAIVSAWRWPSLINVSSGSSLSSAMRPAADPNAARNSQPHIDPETWDHLGDPASDGFVDRLRAKGYPPVVVRAIVEAQVREQFAARYQALAQAAAAVPYWRGSSFSIAADPNLERDRRALNREVYERAAQLLGSSGGEMSDGERRALQRRFGDLSSEKLAALQRINADYDDLIAEARTDARGLMLPGDAQKLALLESEKRADLARLLSPEELENFDLRSSPVSNQLRQKLTAFNPTAEEFNALYRAQQSFNAQLDTGTTSLSPGQRQLQADAQRQLAAKIEASLGPQRYADYQRTTDPAWLTADRFVTQLGLPATTTPHLVAVQQDITQRISAVRANATLTPEQKQLQLAGLAQEANARLTPALGERGLAAYKQNTGYWLQALQTPPRPQPAR